MPVDKEVKLDDIIIDTKKDNNQLTIEEKIKEKEKTEYNNSAKKIENFWSITTDLLPVILFIIILIDRVLHHVKLHKIYKLLEDSPLNNDNNKNEE